MTCRAVIGALGPPQLLVNGADHTDGTPRAESLRPRSRCAACSARSTAAAPPSLGEVHRPARFVARSDHPPERSGRIGLTPRAVTAKPLNRARSGTDRRRRGFVSGGHSALLLNRCFTNVRQTAADAASSVLPRRASFSTARSGAPSRRLCSGGCRCAPSIVENCDVATRQPPIRRTCTTPPTARYLTRQRFFRCRMRSSQVSEKMELSAFSS